MIEYYSAKGKVRKVIYVTKLIFSFSFFGQKLVMVLMIPWIQIDAARPIEEVFGAVKAAFTPPSDKVRLLIEGHVLPLYALCIQ